MKIERGIKTIIDIEFDEQQIDLTLEKVIEWRRYFHENPELSFQEVNTSNYIYETLKSFSNLIVERPTKTSVIAKLQGGRPGKNIALRADIDALPINEETDLSFSSKTKGLMHACGHDGHIAMLLGTVNILTEIQNKVPGTIIFIFQHAEELLPGGASEIVKTDIMSEIDEIVGMHLFSTIPTGKVFIKPNYFTANSDVFDIEIIGKGGHASEPQSTIDPLAIGSQIVNNLQHIIARYIDPSSRAVISITEFNAGTAKNIIPDRVKIGGSVRTFNQVDRENIVAMIDRIASGICDAHGATMKYEFGYGYDSIINDTKMSEKMIQLVKDRFVEDTLYDSDALMIGEDFSAYLKKVPGCFIGIGAGHEDDEKNYPHHHSKFNINEEGLRNGLNVWIHTPFYLNNI